MVGGSSLPTCQNGACLVYCHGGNWHGAVVLDRIVGLEEEGGYWEDCMKVRLQGPNLAITRAVHNIPRGLNLGYPRSPGQEHPPERKTLTTAYSVGRSISFLPIHSACGVMRQISNRGLRHSPLFISNFPGRSCRLLVLVQFTQHRILQYSEPSPSVKFRCIVGITK